MHYLWLCPVCLVLAAIFIGVEKSGRYAEACIIKGVASFVFVVLGWLGWLHVSAADSTYVGFIIAGLAVGAVADVVLNMRYVFEGEKSRMAFLTGIVIFLIGHVLYIIALSRVCSMLPLFIGIGLVLSGALTYWTFQQIETSLAYKVFGVFYLSAITVMNAVAVGALLTRFSTHAAMFVMGALLFLLSDIILILNTFGPEKRFSRRVANLMLYYMGQLLIALSIQLL